MRASLFNTYSTLGLEDEYTSVRPYWTIFLEAGRLLMLLGCSYFWEDQRPHAVFLGRPFVLVVDMHNARRVCADSQVTKSFVAIYSVACSL